MWVAPMGSLLAISPAVAANNVAEQFVQYNIQKGLEILNDKNLSEEQRSNEFESLLLSLMDMKRIAMFTLGQYRRSSSPAEIDSFAAAFQDYAVALYQLYLAKYAGQTLKVTGSRQRAPDDFVVTTQMIDRNSNQPPLEVDFRIRTDTGKPILVDFSVSGIWLSLEERDEFVDFLGENGGSIPSLIAHLNTLVVNLRRSQ